MRGSLKGLLVIGLLFLVGCSSSTTNVGSLVLPTSNRTIDVVQHRSDSHECVVGVVIQTYSSEGQLIDSKSAHGTALHCRIIETGIEAGSRVGSAAIIARGMVNAAKATKPDTIDITNVNAQAQGQGQGQLQGQLQGQSQGQLQGQSSDNINVNSNSNHNTNANLNSNKAEGGSGGQGGIGGAGGNGGNGGNGGGNEGIGTQGGHHDNNDGGEHGQHNDN